MSTQTFGEIISSARSGDSPKNTIKRALHVTLQKSVEPRAKTISLSLLISVNIR